MKRALIIAALVAFTAVTATACGGSSSSASKSDRIAVPNVVGEPLPQASKTLKDLGFEVKETAPDSAFGVVDEKNWVVKSQKTAAGTKTAKGSSIELIVARPVTVTTTTGDGVAAPTTLVHGQALVDAIKSGSMANDPMLMPLVDAEWKSGFLVLTYQEDDPQMAANLCDFVHNSAPAGLTSGQLASIQVVGPTGKELAVTRLTGPGCKAKS